jgi:CheY-like chemotaxis protein
MISTKYEFEGRAKAAGVNEFLKKPFNVPELEKAITAVKANVPRETVA